MNIQHKQLTAGILGVLLGTMIGRLIYDVIGLVYVLAGGQGQ